MRQKTKEIFDEMIKYHNKIDLPNKHLKKAFQEMEAPWFALTTKDILYWLKEVAQGLVSLEKLEFYLLRKDKFANLFLLCPFLNDIFQLKDEYLIWADNITDTEKVEIKDYVDKNIKFEMRVRMRKN